MTRTSCPLFTLSLQLLRQVPLLSFTSDPTSQGTSFHLSREADCFASFGLHQTQETVATRISFAIFSMTNLNLTLSWLSSKLPSSFSPLILISKVTATTTQKPSYLDLRTNGKSHFRSPLKLHSSSEFKPLSLSPLSNIKSGLTQYPTHHFLFQIISGRFSKIEPETSRSKVLGVFIHPPSTQSESTL